MPQIDRRSLWTALASTPTSGRFFCAPEAQLNGADLLGGSSLSAPPEELRGRSVLLATTDQLTAALALIELDGIVRHLVLCPPDLALEHLPFIIRSVPVDLVVSNRSELVDENAIRCGLPIAPSNTTGSTKHETEWILRYYGTKRKSNITVQ